MVPPAPGAHWRGAQPEAKPPRWEVADIFRLSGDPYRHTHRVTAAQGKVMEAILACRTAPLGGHAEQCPQCGFARYAYTSCRHRHCPKGHTATKARGVEARRAELLPVPSFHTVLTRPHELNPLLLGHKRLLLGLLCRAASETLLPCGRQNLGGHTGASRVLHPWNQVLQPHCHLHTLVSGDALAAEGTHWVPPHSHFLFPVKALGEVFRGTFLDALRQLHTQQPLTWKQETKTRGIAQGFPRLVEQLYPKDWVVYAKRPFAGPQQVLESSGR